MKTEFMAVVAIIFVLIITALIKSKNRGSISAGEKPPYFKKRAVLNEKEQVLFHRLAEAMPNHIILAQVRLADIVGVKKGSNWQKWFNKISRKSVDFVICEKSFVVLACVELDGKTHSQEDRKKADQSKDESLQAAGIP